MFVAITFPFFGGLLGFFGGFAVTPTTYFVSHEKLQIVNFLTIIIFIILLKFSFIKFSASMYHMA